MLPDCSRVDVLKISSWDVINWCDSVSSLRRTMCDPIMCHLRGDHNGMIRRPGDDSFGSSTLGYY
jgi:hypothetical protein